MRPSPPNRSSLAGATSPSATNSVRTSLTTPASAPSSIPMVPSHQRILYSKKAQAIEQMAPSRERRNHSTQNAAISQTHVARLRECHTQFSEKAPTTDQAYVTPSLERRMHYSQSEPMHSSQKDPSHEHHNQFSENEPAINHAQMSPSHMQCNHSSKNIPTTDQAPAVEPPELSNMLMAPRRERRTRLSQRTETMGHETSESIELTVPIQESVELGSSSKKRRGPSRCHYLDHLSPGETLHVHIVGGDAVGVHSALFHSFLGKVARTHIPLTTRDFRRDVSQSTRDTILRVLEGSFSWERTPEIDRRILCHAADLHRQYRCLLKKKYFDESIPLEEMRRRLPKGINATVWRKLVDYWSSEEYKKKTGKNKETRAKGIHPTHRMGRKNINQKREEFRKDHSRDPTRVEMYFLTKTCEEKNGERKWKVTEQQKEYDKMMQLMTPKITSSNDVELPPPLSAEEAFTVVKGPERSGRVRCAGRGAIPSAWCGGKANTSTQEVVQLRSTVEVMKEKLCAVEEKMTNMMEMHRLDMERLISLVAKGSKGTSSHESGGIVGDHGHYNNSEDDDYDNDDDDEYYSDGDVNSNDM